MEFSFNNSLRRIFYEDKKIIQQQVKESFLERIGRKKANRDMKRLFELNVPKGNKPRLLSYLLP